jgi:hypothetical protein
MGLSILMATEFNCSSGEIRCSSPLLMWWSACPAVFAVECLSYGLLSAGQLFHSSSGRLVLENLCEPRPLSHTKGPMVSKA